MSFNFNVTTWRLPHWATVIGSGVGGAIISYVATVPSAELLTDLTTEPGLIALAKGAAIAGLAAFVGVAKQILSPQAQSAANALAKSAVAVLCFAMLAGSVSACTKAQWATAGVAFDDILAGLQHGESVEQIELQVAQDAGFGGVVNTIVVTIVVDALDELLALHVIPANLIPTATKMEGAEADKLAGMGGHLPHALLSVPTPLALLAQR